MAFDFGLRQIGVAVGNTESRTSNALTVLRAREGQPDWEEVGKLILEWRPDLLLVGDPLNMDGSASEVGVRAARFARRLHGRFGLPVTQVDERLSSREAREQARATGRRHDPKARPVDALAADIILRSWLDQHC